MIVYAFVLILDPGAMSSMRLHPVAPALFGSCIFFLMLIIYVVYPTELLKKKKKKRKDAGKMHNK